MAYDFKKEEKKFYRPSKKPTLIDVPTMTYLTVHGSGDPNQAGGEYQHALELLYSLAYTIKMSKMGEYQPSGYFDFVVPPLEGFWWQPGVKGVDYQHKENFHFISAIRMPSFVTSEVFQWAVNEATAKKKLDFTPVKLTSIAEGQCAQIMHVGPYDNEPATVAKLYNFIKQTGYQPNYTDQRHHHEIYLSDPRRTKSENLKTIIRIPIKQINK
ncbi:GyrI-like domain-containing protein [Limosilactobacillus albertensis]|uniref:GyrI-like domain-containing protein n=1 Tax=Limosilactobacillus albertensis TaxID=2759752 RepID=A0A839H3P4_9LACO|nr:GyrI-like domain-containing protein [Limosilactobacillus albertensis]MBB1124364.1 GyrI-like domain-containing protein [Limosilactobacillus albertensis]MCD7122244.1 GyrI-like domain-containing protein [Limosilactobacillus albertensis]